MFGNTIKEVMELQKQRFPERKLPWIQVTLSKQVSRCQKVFRFVNINKLILLYIDPETEWIPNRRNISCASRCRGSGRLQESSRQMGMA